MRIVNRLENIDLLGMPHVCSLEIACSNVFLSLLEMVLVRILQSTQRSETGLQLFNYSFLSFFGSKVIITWVIEGGRFLFRKRTEL